MPPSRVQVYLDISIGTKAGGRVVFELFNDVAHNAVENFRGLCTGEYGLAKRSGRPLTFKGCRFFRVVPGVLVQSGDFEFNNGQGGESVFGGTFRDESMLRRHCQAGVLSMANTGPHSNASQFFITLRRAPQLDGKHVAFGQVVEGMEVLRAIEKCPIDAHQCPRVPIVIVDCGMQKRLPGMRRNDPRRQMRETVESLMAALAPASASTKPPTDAQRGLRTLQNVLAKATAAARSSEAQPTAVSDSVQKKPSAAASPQSVTQSDENVDAKDTALSSSNSESSEESETLQDEDARRTRLNALRLRLAENRRLNAKEVALEAKQHSDPRSKYWNVQQTQKSVMRELTRSIRPATNSSNTDTQHESDAMSSEDELTAKQRRNKRKAEKGQWKLDEPAEAIQRRDSQLKKKKANAAKAFGWNVMNTDATFRAHKKRTADLKLNEADYSRQIMQLGDAFYDPTSVLVSAEFTPTEQAKERLVASVETDKAKRKAFSRRRMYIEGETVAYVNDFNRSFNQKLERAYGAHCVEIRQNLERGGAV